MCICIFIFGIFSIIDNFSENESAEDDMVSLIHFTMEILILLNKEWHLSTISSSYGSEEGLVFRGIYTLLIIWLYSFKPAVQSIINESQYLHFLLEQIKKSSLSFETQGLAAFLYGLLILYGNQDTDRIHLISILKTGIGFDLTLSRLLRFKESDLINPVKTKVIF